MDYIGELQIKTSPDPSLPDWFTNERGLAVHQRTCKSKPRSRAGTLAEKAVEHKKRVELQKQGDPVTMEGKTIKLPYEAKSLGYTISVHGEISDDCIGEEDG